MTLKNIKKKISYVHVLWYAVCGMRYAVCEKYIGIKNNVSSVILSLKTCEGLILKGWRLFVNDTNDKIKGGLPCKENRQHARQKPVPIFTKAIAETRHAKGVA